MRQQKAELVRLLKKPDEVVWEHGDAEEESVRFDAFDADELEKKYNAYLGGEGEREVLF